MEDSCGIVPDLALVAIGDGTLECLYDTNKPPVGSFPRPAADSRGCLRAFLPTEKPKYRAAADCYR
jgi:hypothetical protein